MIGFFIVAGVFVALAATFAWFYLYSRTMAWGESETRKALLNVMIVVGPIFGMHYERPHAELPTISAPDPDHQAEVPGVTLPESEVE